MVKTTLLPLCGGRLAPAPMSFPVRLTAGHWALDPGVEVRILDRERTWGWSGNDGCTKAARGRHPDRGSNPRSSTPLGGTWPGAAACLTPGSHGEGRSC